MPFGLRVAPTEPICSMYNEDDEMNDHRRKVDKVKNSYNKSRPSCNDYQ